MSLVDTVVIDTGDYLRRVLATINLNPNPTVLYRQINYMHCRWAAKKRVATVRSR